MRAIYNQILAHLKYGCVKLLIYQEGKEILPNQLKI